ncbi:RNA ligase, T4 RnlA family, partial [Escherichia coli]
IRFKSKTSIKSEQAVEASAMLASIEHLDLAEALIDLAKDGFTANFEYCSPQNRIVLSYPKKMLVLLNVRENDTGEYV